MRRTALQNHSADGFGPQIVQWKEEAASEPEELIACSEQRCSIHARVVVPVCCRDDNQAIQALRWFANLASKADNTSTAFADPLARLVFRVRWLQQVAPSAP